jgi:predicted PhzF superfamily epimerase YddE/YHI9
MDADEKRRIAAECRDLVISLGVYTDHGENDKAAAIFTPDGEWVRAGKPVTGHARLLASMNDRPPSLVVRHMIANVKIDVADADAATGVTYYTAYNHDTGANPPKLPAPLGLPFSIGEWHDNFARTPQGWRIARRETKRLFQRPDNK